MCLLIGVQLQNPFYSIWVTDLGTNLALGFIILAGISAGLYFLFLCYMIRRVFATISSRTAAFSHMSQVFTNQNQGDIEVSGTKHNRQPSIECIVYYVYVLYD